MASSSTTSSASVWPTRIADYELLERLPRRTNPTIGRLFYGCHAAVYRAQLTPTALAEAKRIAAASPPTIPAAPTNGNANGHTTSSASSSVIVPPLWTAQFAIKIVYSPVAGVTMSGADAAVTTDRQLTSRVPSSPYIIGIHHSFYDRIPTAPYPPQWDADIHASSTPSLFAVAELAPFSLADVVSHRIRMAGITAATNGQVLTIREILAVARDISGALSHLQAYLVAHRDIKPDHILVKIPSTMTREQAVSDLTQPGISMALGDYGECYDFKAAGCSTLSMAFPPGLSRGGASQSLAPEIDFTDRSTTVTLNYERADIWSLGLLLLNIMAPKVIEPLDSKKVLIPSSLPTATSSSLRRLIQHMLVANPAERWNASLVHEFVTIALGLIDDSSAAAVVASSSAGDKNRPQLTLGVPLHTLPSAPGTPNPGDGPFHSTDDFVMI